MTQTDKGVEVSLTCPVVTLPAFQTGASRLRADGLPRRLEIVHRAVLLDVSHAAVKASPEGDLARVGKSGGLVHPAELKGCVDIEKPRRGKNRLFITSVAFQ